MDIIQQNATIFITLAIIFGLYMTWGIGANDVANVMGTSVGSGAITVRTAIIIAAIFEFAGAAIAGGHVTQTIRKGIIDPAPITNNPEIMERDVRTSSVIPSISVPISSSAPRFLMESR